jgi:hypothetical protein
MIHTLRSSLLAAGFALAAGTLLPAPVAAQGRPDAIAHVDERIGELDAKLGISATQRPLWNRFTQAMRDNARRMDDRFHRRADTVQTMSAAENMQSYAQLVQAHGQDVQGLATAFDTLYAGLSEPQRRIADQSFRDESRRGDPMRSR